MAMHHFSNLWAPPLISPALQWGRWVAAKQPTRESTDTVLGPAHCAGVHLFVRASLRLSRHRPFPFTEDMDGR